MAYNNKIDGVVVLTMMAVINARAIVDSQLQL